MKSAGISSYAPLGPEACHVLADTLGDTPETVISVHLLRRGLCRAYVAGEPSRFEGAIVQADAFPTEPTGFGSDPEVLWGLLRGVRGWDCVLVDSGCARPLGEIVTKEVGIGVRYLDDVCHTLTGSAAAFEHEAVRQLTLTDLKLLESAPPELSASCWESIHALLAGGIVACAIVSGRAVATALTAARTERYADVGVYTDGKFRRRGFATATASIVARRVQEAGQIPVWGAGEHNVPSLRVAQKLGFVEVSRRTYMIMMRD